MDSTCVGSDRETGVSGIAAITVRMLSTAEDAARAAGKTLLVLDTASPDAERLYARAGWVKVGVIPNYALWPQGGFCDTTYFYKALE